MKYQAKIRLFEKMVLGEVTAQVEREKKKVDDAYERLLEERRRELKEREEAGVAEERRLLERKKRRAIAEASRDAKGEVLEAREAAIDSTIEDLIDRLEGFIEGKAYRDFLRHKLQKALAFSAGWSGLVITFTSRDRRLESEIAAWTEEMKAAADLRFDGEGFSGGFIVTSAEEGTRIDATLETYIAEHRQAIGRSVIRYLEGGEG